MIGQSEIKSGLVFRTGTREEAGVTLFLSSDGMVPACVVVLQKEVQ